MKILHIVQTLDPTIGGVAAAVRAQGQGMAQRGHEIDIVSLDDPTEAFAFPACSNLRWHALGRGLTSYHYSMKLRQWLSEHYSSFDGVIVHGIWQHPDFAVWRESRRSDTPYYVFPHGMLDPWFKRTFPLKHLKKWLYWPWGEYRVLRDATAVIFTCEEERLRARESFWLYRAHERISPLGIDLAPAKDGVKEKFLSLYPQLQNKRVLLFLGRLHPKKGCDILLRALEEFPEFSLVMAGPDQVGWKQALQAQMSDGLTARVLFPGMLEGDAKDGALALAEAFILPSHQENFGVAVVEAMAAGLPVLLSREVNIWREIDQDKAGFIEADDLPGTRNLLGRWRATSPGQRKEISENAKHCYRNRFTLDRSVDSLLSIVANEPARPIEADPSAALP